MTDEGMMVAIPVEEYEYLKECKDRLMEIHKQQIIELRGEMMTAGISAIINNTLVNHTSAYLKNLIKKIT